jgi:LPS O-antigen subunit length determinant protein (WzzB/FepE family)
MIDRQGENESFDIDLREIAVLLYARKVLILSITFLVSAIAALVLLLLPNVYTSSAVLIPTQSQNGALGSLAGQYGGLADLAGISLPAMDEDNKADIAKQLMVSRFFIGNRKIIFRRNAIFGRPAAMGSRCRSSAQASAHIT